MPGAPEPAPEPEPEEEEAEEEEPRVLRAEWISQLEGHIAESLQASEARVLERVQALLTPAPTPTLNPAPSPIPSPISDPIPEPTPTPRPLLGFLYRQPSRRRR